MSAIICFFLFYLLVMFFWYMSIWGGWAEKTYDKIENQKSPWFWLKVFKIEETKENLIKLIKVTSAIGMVLFTILAIISLIKI